MVCAVLCAGLYPNVVQCKRRGKRTAFYTKEVGKVDIHPGSVNAGVHIFPLPYMVYSEKVKTTSIYIRDSTNISDYALLLFGGNLVPTNTGDGIEMLGGYLHFSASKSVLDLIKVILTTSNFFFTCLPLQVLSHSEHLCIAKMSIEHFSLFGHICFYSLAFKMVVGFKYRLG